MVSPNDHGAWVDSRGAAPMSPIGRQVIGWVGNALYLPHEPAAPCPRATPETLTTGLPCPAVMAFMGVVPIVVVVPMVMGEGRGGNQGQGNGTGCASHGSVRVLLGMPGK